MCFTFYTGMILSVPLVRRELTQRLACFFFFFMSQLFLFSVKDKFTPRNMKIQSVSPQRP